MKLRVSWLDRWRRFLRVPEYTEEKLLQDLSGGGRTTEYAAMGTAFHRVLERMVNEPERRIWSDLAIRREDGYEFWLKPDIVDIDLPALPAEAEAAASRGIGGGVELIGHADLVSRGARRVWDYKTTQRIDLETFASSYQWRAYLDLFDADRFTYLVFQVQRSRGDDAVDPATRQPVWAVNIIDFDHLDCWRYGAMRSDVESAAHELAEFCADRGFEGYKGA